MDFKVGHILVDTYRIERLIAEGGMGSVYEASHLRVPKRFAVKFLNVQLVDKSEALVRFRREAEIIATLDHPNIVNLFDYNVTEDGIPYIVLEYLDGEHLGKRLDRGKMTLREAIRVIVPVVHALGAAHRRGIVHRDLKPENIVLCKGEQVKVVDFGIAKICGYDLTGMNSIIGTVPYMSPEQIGGGAIDGRADQFAMGSITYEMLSGRMAFGGSQSVPEVAMRVMHHQPPFLSEVSQIVNETIFKAMSKDPNGRFPDLDTFLSNMLEAASRPEDESVVVEGDDDGEGLPPLAGEATSINYSAPVEQPSPVNTFHNAKTANVAQPVVPTLSTPIPVPPSARPLAQPSPDLAPLPGQATAITPRTGRSAQIQSQSTELLPVISANPVSSLPPAAEVDAARFKPLVTAMNPILDISSPPSAPSVGPKLTAESHESTAITRPAPDGAAGLRILHSVPTVRRPSETEIPATPGDLPGVGGDNGLRMTAEVARPQLTPAVQPASGSHQLLSDDTGKMQLPPVPANTPSLDDPHESATLDGEPVRSKRSSSALAFVWITVAVAAFVIVLGLVVRRLAH